MFLLIWFKFGKWVFCDFDEEKNEEEISDEKPLTHYSTKKWRFQKDRKISRKMQ